MNTALVFSFAVAGLLLSTTYAASPETSNVSTTVAQRFNARTGEWIPDRPKPVVANHSPSQPKAQRMPWNPKRAAMQPVRFIVMVVKAPLMLVGYPLLAIGCAATHQEIPDPGPMFENFDPGPAIDADLERTSPRQKTVPKDEHAPVPFESDVRITRAKAPSTGRSPASAEIALSR